MIGKDERMKRFAGCALAALAAACMFAAAARDARITNADPFNDVFVYKTTWSTLAPNSAPNLDIQLSIDCQLGAGSCPATSNAPLFDVAATQYTANVVACTVTNPGTGACAGKVPTDARLGTVDMQLSTNLIAARLPDNVDATTGTVAACGGAGTSTLTQTFTIYNGNTSASALVSGKDGPDLDNLPDTEADASGVDATDALTPGPNGIPDGADGLPDYIKLMLDTSLPTLISRGFGVAQIVPQSAQVDVNFLTLNLGPFGGGYASVTTIGDVRPMLLPDANASQATETCAPFASTVHLLGTSQDSFGTSWTANGVTTTHLLHELPTVARTITGSAGDPIHYAIDVSGAEDVDGDGVPATIDRCPNPDVGLFPSANSLTASSGATDTDGDGMGDSCDPDPLTANNCPGTAFPGKSAACAGDLFVGPNYPTKEAGCSYTDAGGSPATYSEDGDLKSTHVTCAGTAWKPDQDIDGDGWANWFDNCPTVYNPEQTDVNADGIGDACQVLVNTAAGPRPPRPLHDHDDFCDAATTVGGITAPGTTCFASVPHAAGTTGSTPTAGIAQDSNDDGFPDFLVVPGFSFGDKNSDSDWDGCPDYSEVSQTASGSACGPSYGVASVPNAYPNTVGRQCGVGITTCLNPKLPNTSGGNECGSGPPITGGGATVTYNSQTMTDTSKNFLWNSLVGKTITSGASSGTIGSNTATGVSLTGNWTGATPGPGDAYTIAPGGGIYLPPHTIQDAAHCVDGGKDDPNGSPDAQDIGLDFSQQDIPGTGNPNGGNADSDGDGCTNRHEVLPNTPKANAGGRDPINKWDFYDVDTNNNGTVGKNRAISIQDTIAILQYIGVSSANPTVQNANGKTYAGDDNQDGISNAITFDRSPAGVLTGPPSGAVSIADAVSNENQIGANCSTP